MQPASFSLIDELILRMEEYNKSQENEEDEEDYRAVEKDLSYHLLIGAFVYRFSYLEELVLKYFCSLFPEYKENLLHLGAEGGITLRLLKATKNILKDRDPSPAGLKKFTQLTECFSTLNKERKLFAHGCWGTNLKGGYTLIKSLRKYSSRQDCHHFSAVDSLISLNKRCKKWVDDFKKINSACAPVECKNIEVNDLPGYLSAIGRFVVHFSELENSIRWCVAKLYNLNDDAFIFCEEDCTLSLLDDLSVKLEGKTFEKIKKDFYALNDKRNDLIHRAFISSLKIAEVKEAFSEAMKLTQTFIRLYMVLPPERQT